MKKIVISIAVVVAVILIIGFVPLMDVPYQDTETYMESVPLSYEATSYVVDDTVQPSPPTEWERPWYWTIPGAIQGYTTSGGVGGDDPNIPSVPSTPGVKEIPIKVAVVDVKNTDDIVGSFTVFFSGFSPMFGSDSLTVKLDLSPGEEKTAACAADTDDIGDWSYRVSPSTKRVEKERTVTHYKKGSIFEYLLFRF